jgi:hypothetical protein
MTMIDEEVLSHELKSFANTFQVSKDATSRIWAAAHDVESPARSRHSAAFSGYPGRVRTLSVAAVLVLVVAGVSVPLFRGESGTAKAPNNLQSASARPSISISGSAFSSSHGAGVVTSTGSALGVGKSGVAPKIESNGSIDLTVASTRISSSFAKLSSLASSDGGFVASTRANTGSRTSATFSSGTIVLQVPQRDFAKLVTQVQQLGRATKVSTSSVDVTAQYVDLQAHITALDASRRQYLNIMTKATTISGILAVQEQLNALQSQIEELQGQLNVLSHETSYGTLSVSLTEAGQPSHASTHRSGIAKAWHDSVGGFVSGFEWLVRLAGPVLFVAIILGALLALGRYVRRFLRRRRI